jgi:hypothetical protein
MALNLDSVNAKLKRAELHAQWLTDEIMPWLQLKTYELRPKVNADSTRYAIVVHVVGDEPPIERWSLMVGDCLHNLRCALDHLVYAIAVHDSATEPPPDATSLMFVIADTQGEFTKSAKRLQSLSAPVQTAIESVQPFNRPHLTLPPLLAVLANLENVDKHRLVRLARPTIGEGDINLSGQQADASNTPEFIPFTGEGLVDKAEIFVAVFKKPAPGLKFDKIEVSNLIALFHKKKDPSDPPYAGQSECMTLLKQLFDEVRTVIGIVAAAVK